jgi:LEA14-like dessication related protein
MKTFFWIISTSLLSAFIISCKGLKEPAFRGIENVKVSRLGLQESTLTLDLHYFNPNKSTLKLKNAEGDAWLDGSLLGHFTIDTLIKIPANADFRMPVTLQMNMKKLVQNSAALLLKDEVTLKVEGKAKVGKGAVFINYPIRYEGKQRTDSLMKQTGKLNYQ